jgi:hypothetical protein
MYSIEMRYLAEDDKFLFRLTDELREVLTVVEASGGAICCGETGEVVGREGCIFVDTADYEDLKMETDAAIQKLSQQCGVSELNVVIKVDDGSIPSPYLPPRLRNKI